MSSSLNAVSTDANTIDADTRVRRALLREKLLVPAEAIVTRCQLLSETASDPGLEIPPATRDEFAKVHAAATKLIARVDEVISKLQETGEHGGAESMRDLRHQIGNELNLIASPCQLMLMEFHDDDRFFGSFHADIEHVRRDVETFRANLRTVSQVSTTQIQVDSPMAPVRTVNPAHVLVIDDQEASRQILTRCLEHEGHTVDFACDGREGLAKLEQHDYELLLLDILMPEINGIEVLRHMRESRRLLATPVIVVSGYDSADDVATCIRLGADGFLTRPVDLALLRARVNASLEKLELRKKEYAQFLPDELVRKYLRNPELLDQSRDEEVTALFCDLKGFSAISERLNPDATMRWLSDVMELLSECVLAEGGVLVDYTGDELFAMWGAPEPQADHQQRACRAARAMLTGLPTIDERWQEQTVDPTRVGIGLNSGIARVGNCGTGRRKKYGPLGNCINVASRVQGATRHLQLDLLLTEPTYRGLDESVVGRRLCDVRVKGVDEPVSLYTLPVHGVANPRLLDGYERALAHFESEAFTDAAALLGNLLKDFPHDGPTLLLMSRTVNAMIDDGEFDPVWQLPSK